MKKKFTVLALMLVLALFASCSPKKEKTNEEEKPVVKEIVTEESSTEAPITEPASEPVSIDVLLGKWQTEDGKFTYDIQEDNVLVVEGPAGTDSDCHWQLEGNHLGFRFSDTSVMGYEYNSEKDILEQLDTDSILVRAED